MAATTLQVNWDAVSFTPAGGGSAVTINRVSGVTFTTGGQVLTYSGDTDRFPVLGVNVANQPRATVTTGNIGAIMGLAPGTAGTFSATHKDARNQEEGDIVFSLIGVVETSEASGQHAQFGQGTLSILGVSADGQTNPLSFTRA